MTLNIGIYYEKGGAALPPLLIKAIFQRFTPNREALLSYQNFKNSKE